MFAFLLKSCAAWAAETPEMRRERAHHGWLTARSNPLLGFLFPYSRADIQYEREFPAFDATCRRLGDQAAEAAIARHPRETADLIVKLAYLRLWDWECFPCDAPPHSFREALPARRETWNDLIQRELPDLDGRPTALQRLHALGCSRLPDAVSLPEGDHARECQRAAALAPRFPATDYEKELVSRWEKKGKPFSDHDYEEFLDVLLRTGRADEALAFCERAISLLPAQERAEARFTRGLLLLHRWDEKGLDDLTAILDDLYDRETALRLACDFCTLTGRAERRAEIWERSRSVLTGRI